MLLWVTLYDVILVFLGANILLDNSNNCKLADFGSSRQIQVCYLLLFLFVIGKKTLDYG